METRNTESNKHKKKQETPKTRNTENNNLIKQEM